MRFLFILTGRGKKKKKMARGGGGGGRLFEGGDYSKYFHQRGAIIEGGNSSRDGYYSRK